MKLIIGSKLGAGVMGALFLLLLTFSPAQVFAQGAEPGGPPPDRSEARRPEGDLVRQLNLTPEQVERIRAIREGNRELRRQIGQRIRAARTALDSAIYVENADETVVEQRARELADAQAALVRLQALAELGVRRILTPEQLEIFRNLRLRAESERRGRRQRGDMQNGAAPTEGGRLPRQRRQRP